MAPVGQTQPQAEQLYWHPLVPIRLFIMGVQSASRPFLAELSWMTFVGQILAHWPHLMQRLRNSSSARAPGGRIKSNSQLSASLPPSRTAGIARTPPAIENMKPRLEASVDVISPALDLGIW